MNSYQTMIIKAKAFRSTKQVIQDALKPFDITMLEWMGLGIINDAKEDGISPSLLAKQLDVTQAYISGLSNRLLSKGYVVRVKNPTDNRTTLLAVSKDGEHVLQTSEKVVRSELREWLSPIERERIDLYMDVLSEVASLKDAQD